MKKGDPLQNASPHIIVREILILLKSAWNSRLIYTLYQYADVGDHG